MFKNSLAIFSLISTLMVSSAVVGQVDIPSPRFRPNDVESIENTRPLAEPGIFNYDTQMFAPLEFTNGKEMEAPTGFFFTYDRLYMSIGRPGGSDDITLTAVPTGSDFIWGNRYEFGLMSDDDQGWGVTYSQSEGSFYAAGQDVSIANPMQVTTKWGDVSVNRIFRQALSRGGYLEPYLGFRYMNVSDSTIEDAPQGLVFNRFKQQARNSAAGIQAGARYSQRRGRFRVSTNASIATLYNQQRYFTTDIIPAGVSEDYFSEQDFTPVLDLRLEMAYNLTRDIALRSGFGTTWAWSGIGRANTLTQNLNPNSNFNIAGAAGGPAGFIDTDFLAAGFSFGIEWKR